MKHIYRTPWTTTTNNIIFRYAIGRTLLLQKHIFTSDTFNIPLTTNTFTPTDAPTVNPTTFNPTTIPTVTPTKYPTTSPSYNPSVSPTKNPSGRGTTKQPTVKSTKWWNKWRHSNSRYSMASSSRDSSAIYFNST